MRPQIRQRLRASAEERFAGQENLWNLVWGRRIAYFVTLGVTLMLAGLPLWHPFSSAEQICSDSRCVLRSLIRPLDALVPGFVHPWVDAIARYPVTAIVLAIIIWLLLKSSGWIECRLRDKSYLLWKDVLEGRSVEIKTKGFRAFREGLTYQMLFRTFKWYSLPALFGVVMVLAILYVPLVAITQIAIQFNEADHHFCPAEDPARLRRFDRATFEFDTRHMCRRPALILEKGRVYEIVFQLPVTEKNEPVGWWDDDVAAKAGSLTRVRASTFFQVLGVPMRRVIEASYLQPLAATADLASEAKSGRVHITKLNLKQDENWPELYRVQFRASKEKDTTLHLFANEAFLPYVGSSFYDNNCGTARVVITKIARPGQGFPLMAEPDAPVTLPKCAKDKLDKQNALTADKPQAL